jgi:hypothetical protein
MSRSVQSSGVSSRCDGSVASKEYNFQSHELGDGICVAIGCWNHDVDVSYPAAACTMKQSFEMTVKM